MAIRRFATFETYASMACAARELVIRAGCEAAERAGGDHEQERQTTGCQGHLHEERGHRGRVFAAHFSREAAGE